MTLRAQFDAAFYRRFYENRRTRVVTPEGMRRQARLLVAHAQNLGVPVRRILDAGCGLGVMRGPLLRSFPKARYVGLEVSDYLCRKYGWVNESLSVYQPKSKFDLVICLDVLQYLAEPDARRALTNLGRLCGGLLYFNVPTLEDWQGAADAQASDGQIVLRPAAWYRERLRRHFRHLGHGLLMHRDWQVHQWEMERPWE